MNNYSLFFFLAALLCLILFLSETFIITEEIVIDNLLTQFTLKEVTGYLEFRDQWNWINYLALTVILIIKITVSTLWILSATILYGYKNTVKEIFRVVIIAEFVWLIPALFTLIWFGFIDTEYDFLDIQYFKPLSLLNFFEPTEVEKWLVFPLQSLNLFEIAYIFVLAFGIGRILKKDFIEALNFTVPVYGTALVTWLVFITFLSINLIP